MIVDAGAGASSEHPGEAPTHLWDDVLDRRVLLAGATGAAAVGVLGLGTSPEVADTYLIDTADVPLKGGVIFGDQSSEPQVVVTHPGRGRFRCFSSICTHQGCLVGEVQRNLIVC